MSRFPQIPGAQLQTVSALVGPMYVKGVNRSGGTRSAGEIVILDVTPANLALGQLLPFTVGTGVQGRVLGVIPEGHADIPDGAPGLVQIAGLHPSVKVSNTGGALTAGDLIGNGDTAGTGEETSNRDEAIGWYSDADYDSSTVVGKKVFLTNPQGVRPS